MVQKNLREKCIKTNLISDKDINRFDNASYTVEAALIMPIIIFVIMALIYMSFYMHDKSKIQAILNATMIQASQMVKHEYIIDNKEIDYIHLDDRGIYFPVVGNLEVEKNKMIESLEKQLDKGLFIANIDDVVIDITHTKVAIKVEAIMNISFLRIKEYFRGSGTKITISSVGRIHYPAEFVRRLDVIEGTLEDVEGYDQIMKKLQDILQP